MGGHPWMYIVPYEEELSMVLARLQQRELVAGRYYPMIDSPPFPVQADSPAPGRVHGSIDEALEASDATGTRSILDMRGFASTPVMSLEAKDARDQEIMKAMAAKMAAGEPIDYSIFGLGGGQDHSGLVSPVDSAVLQRLYGTARPSREQVEGNPDFLDDLGRGEGLFIVLYDADQPTEICFAGYSYD